jgi:hypothetical protein
VKLQDYRKDSYEFSGKASDLARQLAFAAIAIIWVFKTDVAEQPAIPPGLILPSILVVAALTLEMIQYCAGWLICRHIYRRWEMANVGEDVELPRHNLSWEKAIVTVFVLKIVCILVAYIWIFVFLARLLFPR